MAFDGIFLHQIIEQLQVLNGCRINKIYQISDTEILFSVKSKEKYQLMISCHSSYNRIHLTERSYPTRPAPSNFIMLMRKHLEGGTIQSIEQAGLDRYLAITVASRNELGDRVKSILYVELMGKYANIILVQDGKIVDALKHIPPFENTRRTVQPGALFKPTDSQPGKLHPFEIQDVDYKENLSSKLIGFSPLLGHEVTFRMASGQKFVDIMEEILHSRQLYVTNTGKEELFHCIPLTHLGLPYKEFEICQGLDYLYYTKEEKERIRQQTGDLFKFTRKEIKKCEGKLAKLNESYLEALDCDKWRQYGDTLYANIHVSTKGLQSIKLKDWEENELVIPLDGKLDLKGNAAKCFQKYRKGINGQKYISEQIEITQNTLDYFNQIAQQLEQADFTTAAEIRSELENNGYMKAKVTRFRKKKPTDPAYLKVTFQDKEICVGKNNIQNEFITFKKANRNDTWFHVKDQHGSHVVINTDHPDEQEIRLCAQLAAYYSKARNSSSVPVNYTLIRQLKKIPGSKIGKVIMKDYQTIFIDIDEDKLLQIIGD